MPPMFKILVILTSHATAGGSGQATGLWLEEFTTPYYAFVDAGAQVDVASIAGGKVPIDPNSVAAEGKNPASVERFLKDAATRAKLDGSQKIDTLKSAGYDAVFMPGGHGTMWDLPASDRLAKLLTEAWGEGKVIAAVCHGPAGLVNAKDEKGQPLVAGRRAAAFTNTEEVAAGMDKTVPFALETRIRALGARYESGPDFQPFAVRDGRLVTGQNPASSEKVAELVLQAVRESAAGRH
ncbi:MAG: glutamine amidotransferase [Candidatus Dactylopiibacterium carminicum]|uniref:Glutamine amidotransferase n=1 Tax=Candidatus Dactylopiibacterium carminicum TaxID=857335 RepID=A0A272EVC2_9RHOO|nr:type 1 glutamine amidotransferase domain-containing protein [Candidatus Dactylopiibacterium carminicum]KAF7600113.1 type 1 glutamine amidotransferase domain-containing protein [Candidatus Dactylopiibacterium carminicum]PAS94057.1 MAG: glutamine amidotransferase [Candidatus Dactylopiibacterium carminicum]PAS98179.1 MAG: glutamine amidotransferase [Candidatus Dactylopiibacterium carminicum]PAT00113.1 MAG: glutamine amidotransferase [Candidatus Dactylopiibacterium carminicum]